ncbi:hypothetical protein HYV70_04725 [Candidatus Uhrbacteria bacterium]|nr:hypothetical protein [Candidatus Uhrbacteria bacterium]
MLREGFTRNENPEKLRRTSSEQYKRFQKHTSFYRLSGDPEPTPRDYERYEKSQERVQKETLGFIVEGLKHGDLSARLGMIEVLAQVPEDQQKELQQYVIPTILEVLRSSDESEDSKEKKFVMNHETKHSC